MRVKIQGGTVTEGETSLCVTCRYATIVRGARLREEIVECSELAYGRGRITFAVRSCSAYSDKRRASIRAMEDIAWILRSDARKNEIGFVRASALRAKDRYVLAEE